MTVYEFDPVFFFLYWGGLGVLLAALVAVTVRHWQDVKGIFWPSLGAVALAFFAMWRWVW